MYNAILNLKLFHYLIVYDTDNNKILTNTIGH